MSLSKFKLMWAPAVIALAFSGAEIAHAQYVPAGNTPGGGIILIGNGTLPALGPGSPLSAGGFDQVTLNIGSVATTSGQDTIQFITSNNILVNKGTVTGAAGFNAITFTGTSSLSGETITNNGIINNTNAGNFSNVNSGGNFNSGGPLTGGDLGVGIGLTSFGTMAGITITNTGAISGGSLGTIDGSTNVGGNYSGNLNFTGGNTGSGIDLSSGDAMSGIAITNSGTISGGGVAAVTGGAIVGGNRTGNQFFTGGNFGEGIDLASLNAISTVAITNTGAISGGVAGPVDGTVGGNHNSNSFFAGGNVGDGIDLTSGSAMSAVTINNSGAISSGGLGAVTSSAIAGNYNGANFTGGNVDAGIDFTSAGAMSGITINNSGAITSTGLSTVAGSTVGGNHDGGDNFTGGNVGGGIDFTAAGAVSGIAIHNSGAIAGSGFTSVTGGDVGGNHRANHFTGGNVGAGIDFISRISISTVTITNSGVIKAGNIGTISNGSTVGANTDGGAPIVGGDVGGGVDFLTLGSITGVTLMNSGTITGGNLADSKGIVGGNNDGFADFTGGNVGEGVDLAAFGAISGINLSNSGVISGGDIGTVGGGILGTNFQGNNISGGNVGDGIDMTTNNSISAITIINSGTISGGSVAAVSGGAIVGNNYQANPVSGGNVGAGIDFLAAGAINGISITNGGAISGGSIGDVSGGVVGGNKNGSNLVGGNVGDGIDLASKSSISGVAIFNSGAITGGNVGNVSNSGTVGGNFQGSPLVGGNVGVGVAIDAIGAINGLSLVNYGTITGGNTGATSGGGVIGSSTIPTDAGGDVGSAVSILSVGGGSNLSVSNFGTIKGGNSASGNAGIGINSDTGNLTINNWGAISAGSGLSTATVAGFPAVAISVAGNNNTINLNGHSSVNGTLQGASGGVNNVLNLNFTGMSPAAIAGLKAQLVAQGYPSTNDFTGTFTVRGVTYFVDPLVLNLNLSSYQLQAVTPNQFAVGASLDSATVNPAPGSSLFNLFTAIDTSGNVPGALSALSPQQYQAYGDLAIANTTAIVQNIDARLNNIRDGSESIDTTGVGGASDATTTAGYSKDDGKESKQVVQTPAPEKRWGFFATGDGLFFRGNNHDLDQQSDRSNSAGTLAGVDAKIGEHFVAGALFAYNNTDATLGSTGNTGHATIESYSGGIYGSYHQDGFYVNSLAAYTRNHYDSDRNILFPGFAGTASANANGNQESVNIDGGYDWHATDRLTLGPIAGLQYVHLDVNGFNEIGAGAADLNVNSENMDSLQSRVGGRINYHLLTTNTSSFAADLHAAWQHEYFDNSRGIGASFVGSGLTPFSVQTTSPLRDAGVVGIGLNFSFHERLTLFADYELLMWSSSTFEQTINGGGRISF